MASVQLTRNFTLAELTASSTAQAKGIKNVPTAQEIANLTALAVMVLQPLREAMGHAIKIGSGYRCAALNKAVGGVSNSQHCTGQAADLCIDGDIEKGKRWFQYIRMHLPFDQLIWERNPRTGNYWVHVSYRADGRNRGQVIENLIKR
ncbi:MAG: peptidase M15 [Bacteroidaceae bacterium]|nr:peptidase M15 [Bacteroidaceae bacterium]